MWIMRFFDPVIAFVFPRIGKFLTYDNKPSREMLGIEYKPLDVMFSDYGHSLIYHGHAKKLPGYVPPSPTWTPADA
jgi:hypothetical protein